jgi:hypothetical protein
VHNVRRLLLIAALVASCQSSERRGPGSTGQGGQGAEETGGAVGTGGATGGTPGAGTGGKVSTPDAADAPDGPAGSGGTGGSAPGPDAMADSRGADGASTDAYPDSSFLPGRPDIRLCKKEWTMEQCCAFLCSCLNTICADSAKAKPGLATCMSWCPKLSSMAARCHVYHCYVSISPTGGINDHDSHCGHAANQVAGGGCPVEAYQ